MTGQNMVLRLKTSEGNHVLKSLTSESTVEDLHKRVSDLTTLESASMKILFGFPPKPLNRSNMSAQLQNIGIKSGYIF